MTLFGWLRRKKPKKAEPKTAPQIQRVVYSRYVPPTPDPRVQPKSVAVVQGREYDSGPGFGTGLVVGAILASGRHGDSAAANEEAPKPFKGGGGEMGGGGASASFDDSDSSGPASDC